MIINGRTDERILNIAEILYETGEIHFRYYENGNIVAESDYEDGKWLYYDKFGKLEEEVE